MMRYLLAAIVGVSALSATRPSPPNAPCLTDSPAADTMLAKVIDQLSSGDSANVVAKGLPFKPVGATIEDSVSVCAWVVDSVNAAETRADSNYQNVSAGYIVRVGDFKVFTTDHPFP